MKKFLLTAICGVMVVGMAMDALAASARVRCRVKSGRVRVQVDGIGLTAGRYSATVTNLQTGAAQSTDPRKHQSPVIIPPARVGNVDLDFDSTAQANDRDSFIPANFIRAGQSLRAVVNPGAVASATTVCTE